MIFVIGIIGLASAIPLWLDYHKNPEDNLLMRSSRDAVHDVQNVVSEVAIAAASSQPAILADLPAWARTLILWGLRFALQLLRLFAGPVARA